MNYVVAGATSGSGDAVLSPGHREENEIGWWFRRWAAG
jgi:hypothetical protein